MNGINGKDSSLKLDDVLTECFSHQHYCIRYWTLDDHAGKTHSWNVRYCWVLATSL